MKIDCRQLIHEVKSNTFTFHLVCFMKNNSNKICVTNPYNYKNKSTSIFFFAFLAQCFYFWCKLAVEYFAIRWHVFSCLSFIFSFLEGFCHSFFLRLSLPFLQCSVLFFFVHYFAHVFASIVIEVSKTALRLFSFIHFLKCFDSM